MTELEELKEELAVMVAETARLSVTVVALMDWCSAQEAQKGA